jgi:hypothetical protein
MGLLKKLELKNQPIPNYGKFVICPTLNTVYVDPDGTSYEVSSDTIYSQEYRWAEKEYRIILPGLVEWVERYRSAVDTTTYKIDPEFNWAVWHKDGLLFTKEIYRRLPRYIQVRYAKPAADRSGLIEDFDVTSEEQIDLMLAQLGEERQEKKPAFVDSVAVGVKPEDEGICVRFKIKGKCDSFTFVLDYESILLLKDFLERAAISEGEVVIWESKTSENGMYLYPQTIGVYKNMYRLHIYSEKELAFTAYLNLREFVRSLYKSIMTHVGGMKGQDICRMFQSNIVECYIDDKKYENIAFFRRFPKIANTIGPAVENVRKYFQEIYESILDDSEYV